MYGTSKSLFFFVHIYLHKYTYTYVPYMFICTIQSENFVSYVYPYILHKDKHIKFFKITLVPYVSLHRQYYIICIIFGNEITWNRFIRQGNFQFSVMESIGNFLFHHLRYQNLNLACLYYISLRAKNIGTRWAQNNSWSN